ncbi:MAG: hypothetical protein WAW23_10530 [Candidatus Methanoperedens sp.]
MNNPVFLILILVSGVSYLLLMILPAGIAIFYEKTFKKRAYYYLFIESGILLLIPFFFFSNNFFSDNSSAFLAAGGVLLAAASLRLYTVMTGGVWR